MAITVTIRSLMDGKPDAERKPLDPILKTENLWKLYHAGKVEVPALRGVNFDVLPGESVAVMGPSGCGKSTLLYVIGGLARASRGKVLVDGNDLTAMGNIAIAQYIHGDGYDPHRFDVVTKMLGLEGRLHHKPSEMSGGEQQRVAIARAIINEPKILLADEPTGNLDTKNSDIVLEMLRRLNKDLGQTIVMITHNPETTTYFDRVVHMRDGIIVDGVPAD